MSEQTEKIKQWHNEAMDLAEMAFFAKRRKEKYNYYRLILRALNLEKAAARLLKDQPNGEPSRSVLYQGAIHFALNLDYFDEARLMLAEVLAGNPPIEIKTELLELQEELAKREEISENVSSAAQGFINRVRENVTPGEVERALNAAAIGAEAFFGKETIDQVLNRLVLQATLENKNLVSNPDYIVFGPQELPVNWLAEARSRPKPGFWEAYKKYLDSKNHASTTIHKLDQLTDELLNRIGDPKKSGIWNKRGMVVGHVQSGKTSNYIGLINKAADAGFHIIIVLSGLYESLRHQTQLRIDEGFSGAPSLPGEEETIGVGKFRRTLPVHPITNSGLTGDVRTVNLKNYPLNTSDYYVLVSKKNPTVLKNLLSWLSSRADTTGNYPIIRGIPLLVIDDEADYASINIDKDFVSRINGYIRAMLGLFEQSAFIGYTATPFANIFIGDKNETAGKEISVDGHKFLLSEDLFPRDFIVNLPPPSNYIGYTKVFDSDLSDDADENGPTKMTMIRILDDFEPYIPPMHKAGDELPDDLPLSLKRGVQCFILVCAARMARGQSKEHNSMLVHVSWYVRWIDRIAYLVNEYVKEAKNSIRYGSAGYLAELRDVWETEFKPGSQEIPLKLDYEDPRIVVHDWAEVLEYLATAAEKIEVRAVHGTIRGIQYENSAPLNYEEFKDTGLSVIAVGGNKLSRGLTLEGLSISYFLRATRFYDTLLQMGRWFGYRPGYVDLCRLFTTKELVTWYRYIGNATDELREQFDIMDLADRTPANFGLKVRTHQGALMISAAAKLRDGTELSLSYSGDLLESYALDKAESILSANLKQAEDLFNRLGKPSGKERQGQRCIWENVSFETIEEFLAAFTSHQQNIHKKFLQEYIRLQQSEGKLKDWTVVFINNPNTKAAYRLKTGDQDIFIGLTKRSEVEEVLDNGEALRDPNIYFIRKSHIISPPHEFLDMDESDSRYQEALAETRQKSKSSDPPVVPGGKYIRKFRGEENALLLIYLLDPAGFGGKEGLPATGFAISLPKLENDIKLPYLVNKEFIRSFEDPDDAIEHPELESENV